MGGKGRSWEWDKTSFVADTSAGCAFSSVEFWDLVINQLWIKGQVGSTFSATLTNASNTIVHLKNIFCRTVNFSFQLPSDKKQERFIVLDVKTKYLSLWKIYIYIFAAAVFPGPNDLKKSEKSGCELKNKVVREEVVWLQYWCYFRRRNIVLVRMDISYLSHFLIYDCDDLGNQSVYNL